MISRIFQILGLKPQFSKVFLDHKNVFFLIVGQNNFGKKYHITSCDHRKINSHKIRYLGKYLESKINKQKSLHFVFDIFFDISKLLKSPASGKENVWFPDSPDFENLSDFRIRRDVR